MPKLNEHRIVKHRNGFFPFNYEGGTIGMFQTYYVVEEWYAPNDYWGWHPIAITTKKAYERFKEILWKSNMKQLLEAIKAKYLCLQYIELNILMVGKSY